jgi:hypothetical protein
MKKQNTHYSLNKSLLKDGNFKPDDWRLVCSDSQRIYFVQKSVTGNKSLSRKAMHMKVEKRNQFIKVHLHAVFASNKR